MFAPTNGFEAVGQAAFGVVNCAGRVGIGNTKHRATGQPPGERFPTDADGGEAAVNDISFHPFAGEKEVQQPEHGHDADDGQHSEIDAEIESAHFDRYVTLLPTINHQVNIDLELQPTWWQGGGAVLRRKVSRSLTI